MNYRHVVLCEVKNVNTVELYRHLEDNRSNTFKVYQNVTNSSVTRIRRFFPEFEVERVDDDGWIKKRGINALSSFVETNPRLGKTYTIYVHK